MAPPLRMSAGLGLVVAALLQVGCPAWGGIPGSGHVVTETRVVGPFSRVDLSGAADVQAAIGPTQSVEVTIDDNLLPLVETKVEDGTLYINSAKNYHSSQGLKVKIVVPSLDGFAVSGAVNLHATGIAAKTFTLNLSGAGKAELQGSADMLDIHLSGATEIQANDLAAKQVKIDLSGVGDAQVCATASLDASVSGAGSVRYRGHPAQVHQNVSGAGSIQAE